MNRVLIIEDEAVARRQLAQLFRFEGFEVIEAEDGRQGITAAARVAPDLVICDIMMPDTDGFGVLEALRKIPETILTPFIFLTAKAGGQDVRVGMSHGADDYITKPFNPDALLASARKRLERRRLQMEEAERRATDAGILAAAALPSAMEDSLSHIERITEVLAAQHDDEARSAEMRASLRDEVSRLRLMSQRLRLYSELPSLYARRFSGAQDTSGSCSHDVAVEAAQNVARHWSRIDDLTIEAPAGIAPLPAEALAVLTRELIDNACKFSPPSTPIVLEIKTETAFWKLSVFDSGMGIQPHLLNDIGAFRQYWSGTERPKGLGLGLVLVQGLARLHAGETLIENQPPRGARVTLLIPF